MNTRNITVKYLWQHILHNYHSTINPNDINESIIKHKRIIIVYFPLFQFTFNSIFKLDI